MSIAILFQSVTTSACAVIEQSVKTITIAIPDATKRFMGASIDDAWIVAGNLALAGDSTQRHSSRRTFCGVESGSASLPSLVAYGVRRSQGGELPEKLLTVGRLQRTADQDRSWGGRGRYSTMSFLRP